MGIFEMEQGQNNNFAHISIKVDSDNHMTGQLVGNSFTMLNALVDTTKEIIDSFPSPLREELRQSVIEGVQESGENQ